MRKNWTWCVLAIAFFLGCGANDLSNIQKGDEDQIKKLEGYVDSISPSYNESMVRANISLTSTNLLELLPNIDEYPMTVDVKETGNVEVVQIYTSSEKAGTGVDGLYVEMAKAFNKQRLTLPNGKVAQISIRKIASGAAASFIMANKYLPDAYSPSNDLWGKMITAQGGNLTLIDEETAPNTAGIIIKSDKVDMITSNGALDIQKLLTQVTSGNFSMGYTNPYQSSTGLNFLITVLDVFAGGDKANMLNPEVAAAFEAFQRGIPFVAQNTLQMREATVNSNVLDAFVMEYQTFSQAKGLGGYEFIPFGVRHDSPLYATEEADADELAVLEMFASFLESKKDQVNKFGFGQGPSHEDSYTIDDGVVIGQAQKIWKEYKSGGRPIAAMFIADISGSMSGDKIRSLKTALVDSSGLISSNNAIGLISYSDRVNVDVPIREFNLQQKSQFIGAVENLSEGGGTATNDALLVALSELRKFGQSNPEHKLVCFLLSDGETTKGMKLSSVDAVIKAVGIPVHTVAYGDGIDPEELQKIAGLVEASFTKSSDDSASYNIGNLLNTQM